MKRQRGMKLARMLVATLAMVGSLGSSPVNGHSHGLTPETSRSDHGFVDHEHSPRHDHEDNDHHEHGDHHEGDDAPQIDTAFFHLHGTWFGLSFSIPASPMPGQVEQAGGVLDLDVALMQAATAGVNRSGWDLPLCARPYGLVSPHCALSACSSPLLSRPFDGACMPDAVLLRSVSLRC